MAKKDVKKKAVKKKRSVKKADHVIFFYGEECPWCHKMMPHVEQVEVELGILVKKLEVWHDEKNAKKYEELSEGKCGGVPFMINKKTGKWLCGYSDVSQIKDLCT